jgi:RNA polymerase sigma-70 factor (ECF subfamily)
MTETDQLLIQNAQADPQQFGSLYQKYVDELHTFIYYHCGNHPELADDLTADIFTKAFQALPNFQWQGYSYRSYLYQLARNRLIDYYRAQHQTPLELDPETISQRSHMNVDVDLRLMWQQIKQLGPDVTELFELRYLQGLSFDEIADILGKSAGALRTTVSRTIDQLQEHFSI